MLSTGLYSFTDCSQELGGIIIAKEAGTLGGHSTNTYSASAKAWAMGPLAMEMRMKTGSPSWCCPACALGRRWTWSLSLGISELWHWEEMMCSPSSRAPQVSSFGASGPVLTKACPALSDLSLVPVFTAPHLSSESVYSAVTTYLQQQSLPLPSPAALRLECSDCWGRAGAQLSSTQDPRF